MDKKEWTGLGGEGAKMIATIRSSRLVAIDRLQQHGHYFVLFV